MIEKRLGKIDFVEFGSMKDYPFQLGLQLGFSMSGSGVMDGGKYTVNMSPDCHWEIGTRHTNLAESLDRVAKILNDAMVRMFGVKETCCTRCSHRDVCQYKSEYLAAQTAVDEVSVRRPSKDDESIRSIRLHDIPWIEPVELKCRYFHQNTGAVR